MAKGDTVYVCKDGTKVIETGSAPSSYCAGRIYVSNYRQFYKEASEAMLDSLGSVDYVEFFRGMADSVVDSLANPPARISDRVLTTHEQVSAAHEQISHWYQHVNVNYLLQYQVMQTLLSP